LFITQPSDIIDIVGFATASATACKEPLKNRPVDDAEETNVDAAKSLESLERAGYSRAIREHLGERLRAYYERAQHTRVADNRLAELIERLSKRLEEQKLQRE
jgi:tRNA C32,U32 (ribose-2'-O)-methylase TrmJ